MLQPAGFTIRPIEQPPMNCFARHLILVLALGFAPTVARTAEAQSDLRSLAGTWRFQLDRDDVGLQERWFERELPQRIHLPGALQNQGFGDDVSVDTK